MNADRWKHILRIVNEAFESYETGMATLSKRVVMDLKRKLSDTEVEQRSRERASKPRVPARSRPAPARIRMSRLQGRVVDRSRQHDDGGVRLLLK